MQEAITNNELLGREPIEAIELLTAGMTRSLSVSLIIDLYNDVR